MVIGGGSRSMKISAGTRGPAATPGCPRRRRSWPTSSRRLRRDPHDAAASAHRQGGSSVPPHRRHRAADGLAARSRLGLRVAPQRDRVPAARRRGGAHDSRSARRGAGWRAGRARERPRGRARDARGPPGSPANKLAAIIDLAAKFVDGTVPTDDLDGLSDDEIVARLVTVRGVGRWTAEMFLLFQLAPP